jgi:hypothetical protein
MRDFEIEQLKMRVKAIESVIAKQSSLGGGSVTNNQQEKDKKGDR